MMALDRRTAWALGLHALAAVALLAGLAGWPGWGASQRAAWVLLVDRSQSMPRSETDAAAAAMQAALRGARVETLAFAGGVGAAGAPAPAPEVTDLEAALQAALARHAETPLAGVAVLSDGQATRGEAGRALRDLQAAGVPVHWQALGRAAPLARLGEVLAPRRVRGSGAFEIAVNVVGAPAPAWRVRAQARGEGGGQQTVTAEPQDGRATLRFDAFQGGSVVVDLALEEAVGGAVVDRRRDAAVVELAAAARVLVVAGSDSLYARSLAAGGWPVRLLPVARLGAEADPLAGVDAVVLDDVAVDDAPPRFWAALERAVRERGIGLVVLGGERAWAAGGYRGSALEAMLPLRAEPPADDARAAVVFAVDKSGSMGSGSAGVDRFAMAQRAVAGAAATLGERDRLGLLVFDVEPRWLLPLGPAGAGREALARDWPVRPAGGTRLAPALEAAIAELAQAPAARRWLVLVTDGFTEAAALPALRAQLARARIETLALAVGPDADVPALQRLFGDAPGTVLRVGEAAELPGVLRQGLERRRARVERGRIGVRPLAPLPFAPAPAGAWPPVAAHAVLRTAPGATLVLGSEKGDALMAHWALGRGRVAALATGFGAWSPAWAAWREWPQLAGGLADWAAGAAAGPWTVAAAPEPGRATLDGPVAASAPGAGPRVAVALPGGQSVDGAARATAPGRWQLAFPEAGPGLYGLQIATPAGLQRWPLLRRAPDEASQHGIAPELEDWQRAGWIRPWDAARAPQGGPAPPATGPDPAAVLLALLLSLAGVAVDRAAFFSGARAWRALRA